MVLLPAPDMPVNQMVTPLCMPHYRSIGGEVNAAFLTGVLFPPPAAGAFGLTCAHRPRAAPTTDAAVAAGVERVHRHVVLMDILVHVCGAPIGQRVELDAAIGLLNFGHSGPGFRLVAAQAGGPGSQRAQFPA